MLRAVSAALYGGGTRQTSSAPRPGFRRPVGSTQDRFSRRRNVVEGLTNDMRRAEDVS